MLIMTAAMVFVIAQGCTKQLGKFTVITTKNIDMSGLEMGNRVTSEHCLLPFFEMPRLQPAVDKALDQGGGDVLVNVHISDTRFYILGPDRICYSITATVAQTPSYNRNREGPLEQKNAPTTRP